MEAPTRPLRDVTTASGYALKIFEYVTMEDEENLLLTMVEKAKPTGEEVADEKVRLHNQVSNFQAEKNEWIGFVVRSITTPSGETIEGEDRVKHYVRSVMPRACAEEVKTIVEDVISPKKSVPTEPTT